MTNDIKSAAIQDAEQKGLQVRLSWIKTARPEQLPPVGDWYIWANIAGRGAGKTRLGAEWTWWETWTNPGTYTHVIAPTWDSDVIGVCFEGPSGILRLVPPECVATWNKSEGILTMTNGSIIRGFSAEKPDRLRGPQCHRMWCDELAAWLRLEETWDMAMMGLRLGEEVKAVITTTPRPVPKVRQLIKDAEDKNSRVIITRGTTYDNRSNLSKVFFDEIVSKYEGTSLGRQEIYAEVIDPEEMGIIKRSWWKLWPASEKLPAFSYIVMSIDTAYSEQDRDKKSGETDFTACTVWGLFDDPKRKGRDSIMLLDAWQDKIGFPELLERVKADLKITYGETQKPLLPSKWGRPLLNLGGGKKIDLAIIEDKAAGRSLIQSLANEQIYAYPYNPGRESKLLRLHSVAHIFANGIIYVPESTKNPGRPMGFAEDQNREPGVISQICMYSGEGSTKHDDWVDTATQAIRYLMDRNFITVIAPPDRDIEAEEAVSARRASNPYKG